MSDSWQRRFEITKTDADKRLAFGWLYVARKANGEQVVDHSGEVTPIEELEKAAYNFVLDHRNAGEMHDRVVDADGNKKVRGVGRLVECICFTAEKRKAMGIPDGILPDGMWVGFRIDDDTAWAGVKSGKYKMLSFGGTALRRSLDND